MSRRWTGGGIVAIISLLTASAQGRDLELLDEVQWRTPAGSALAQLLGRLEDQDAASGELRHELRLVVSGPGIELGRVAMLVDSHRRRRPFSRPRLSTVELLGRERLVIHRAGTDGTALLVSEAWDLIADPQAGARGNMVLVPVFRQIVAATTVPPECEPQVRVELRPANPDGSRVEWRYEWPILGPGQRGARACRRARRGQKSYQYEWKNGCFAEIPGQPPPSPWLDRLWAWKPLYDWRTFLCVPGLGRPARPAAATSPPVTGSGADPAGGPLPAAGAP